MRGGHPQPAGSRVRVPLRRHRARQRRHPRDAARAGRRPLGERVQQLVDVDAALRGGRRLRAAELVAEPAVGAAGEPAGVLQQPGLGIGVRVQLDEPGRVVCRLGDDGAHRLGRAHDVAHDPRLDDARARASRPSRPRPRARRACRRRVPSPPATSRGSGPRTASGRITGARRPGSTSKAAHASGAHSRRARIEQACRGGVRRIDGQGPRRPPGDPRARQQECLGRAVGARARAARARRSSRATCPGSRLQPVSARSASGSMRSADCLALGAGAPVAPDQCGVQRRCHRAAAATRPSSWEPKESATISRPAVATRIRDERRDERGRPLAGILLGPSRLRVAERVRLVARRDQRPVRLQRLGAGAL